MANVSPHFNHYHSIREQSLIQDLVDESIYMRGLEVYYIPRVQENIDYLFNEDVNQLYKDYKTIAMYPLFVDGFDGEEMMGMFGSEFKKNATFVVSKRKWKEKFPEVSRPMEGDLIFMPITNAFLEIKYTNNESPFFEKGKQYVYELKTEAFEYSHEEFHEDILDEDALADSLASMIIEDPENDTGKSSINDDLTDVEDLIAFDPNNPFGVR